MSFTDFTDDMLQAHLHKEVYVAMLRSALQEWGSQLQLCERLRNRGIEVAPSYLQYLLDPLAYESLRSTTLLVLQAIVHAAPMDRQQREVTLEHIYLAHQLRSSSEEAVRSLLTDDDPAGSGGSASVGVGVGAAMEGLRQAHQAASFAADPLVANAYYRVLRDASKSLLARLSAKRHPIDFVEVCLLLHDAQCVLNRPDDALYHAKLARWIMTGLYREEYQDEDENESWRFDHYLVNSILAEGLAYHNMGLDGKAYTLYEEADHVLKTEAPSQASFWPPYINRMKLNGIRGRGRFTVKEVHELANSARIHAEKRDDDHAPLVIFLVDEALGRALTEYGGARALRRADEVLTSQLYSMETVPHLGPLHRTILYGTFARLRSRQGDTGERGDCSYFVELALNTAHTAGLEHQVHKLQQEFPTQVSQK